MSTSAHIDRKPIVLTSLVDGQVLAFHDATGHWVNKTIPDAIALDGSTPMGGSLKMAGFGIEDVGLIDGRNIASDGVTLDAIAGAVLSNGSVPMAGDLDLAGNNLVSVGKLTLAPASAGAAGVILADGTSTATFSAYLLTMRRGAVTSELEATDGGGWILRGGGPGGGISVIAGNGKATSNGANLTLDAGSTGGGVGAGGEVRVGHANASHIRSGHGANGTPWSHAGSFTATGLINGRDIAADGARLDAIEVLLATLSPE